MKKLCLGVALIALMTPAPSHADPSGFCGDGELIIVDGQQHCVKKDTLFQLISDYQDFLQNSNPYAAGNEGDEDALRRLPDVSPENDQSFNEAMAGFQSRHSQINRNSMASSDQLNYDLFGFALNQHSRRAPFDESRIPFTNDSGFFNELSYVSRQTSFKKPEDFEAYAARLSTVPRYFGQHKANMRRGVETNFTASKEIMPGIIDMVRKLSEYNADAHPYFAPFNAIPENFSDDDRSRLKALGRAAMDNAVLPAYKDLLKFLEDDYLPKAREQVGIGTMAEGRAYYTSLVRHYTTLDLTPDEVHEIGLKEVARIRSEMDDIIKDVGFKGSFADFLEYLRTDPKFYAQSEEELLKEAAWLAKQVDGKMPEFFKTMPRLPYGVMKVPDEMAPNYTTGRYWGGDPDQGKAGNYVVNTYDLTQRPLYNLPALTLHEGVPGHHHQISLGQELEGVPKFRKSLYPTAFGEGWGLYSEKLGIEMGLYKTPYDHFGRLSYEMWRACRLVVDTGMHWKGWTREQAEACFLENSALAKHNITTEVERYISWPGQALAYKIGELKIIELRERAEAALGEKFSIREFHDAVLLQGGLPLSILETRIDNWISEQLTKIEP